MTKCRKGLPVGLAAQELGVSEQHVYNLLSAGLIEAYDISVSGKGGPQSIRVSVESIIRFKMNRKIDPERLLALKG